MRIVVFVLLLSILELSVATESFGQKMSVRDIKRNNKRMTAYRGKRDVFKRYSSVGFSVNALNYFGDLSPLPNKFSTDISFTKPGFGIYFSRCYGPRYTLSGQFMYGTLSGSDTNSAHRSDLGNGIFRYERNLSFRNRIKELTVTATFDLFENHGSTYMHRVDWTPFVYVGLGALLHNPEAQAPSTYLDGSPNPKAGQWVDLQPLGTEGQYSNLQPGDVNYGIKPYNLLQVVVPFGIGTRIRLSDVLDLSGSIGFHYTFTDYLDDVSRNYVDLGALKDPLSQAMSYRSNELSDISKYPTSSYVGRDGKTYNTIDGYGREFKTNNRGNFRDNDIYMVTSIKITRILAANFHKAKFR